MLSTTVPALSHSLPGLKSSSLRLTACLPSLTPGCLLIGVLTASSSSSLFPLPLCWSSLKKTTRLLKRQGVNAWPFPQQRSVPALRCPRCKLSGARTTQLLPCLPRINASLRQHLITTPVWFTCIGQSVVWQLSQVLSLNAIGFLAKEKMHSWSTVLWDNIFVWL